MIAVQSVELEDLMAGFTEFSFSGANAIFVLGPVLKRLKECIGPVGEIVLILVVISQVIPEKIKQIDKLDKFLLKCNTVSAGLVQW